MNSCDYVDLIYEGRDDHDLLKMRSGKGRDQVMDQLHKAAVLKAESISKGADFGIKFMCSGVVAVELAQAELEDIADDIVSNSVATAYPQDFDANTATLKLRVIIQVQKKSKAPSEVNSKQQGLNTTIHTHAATFLAQHPDGRFVTRSEGSYWGLGEAVAVNAIMKELLHPGQSRGKVTDKLRRYITDQSRNFKSKNSGVQKAKRQREAATWISSYAKHAKENTTPVGVKEFADLTEVRKAKKKAAADSAGVAAGTDSHVSADADHYSDDEANPNKNANPNKKKRARESDSLPGDNNKRSKLQAKKLNIRPPHTSDDDIDTYLVGLAAEEDQEHKKPKKAKASGKGPKAASLPEHIQLTAKPAAQAAKHAKHQAAQAAAAAAKAQAVKAKQLARQAAQATAAATGRRTSNRATAGHNKKFPDGTYRSKLQHGKEAAAQDDEGNEMEEEEEEEGSGGEDQPFVIDNSCEDDSDDDEE